MNQIHLSSSILSLFSPRDNEFSRQNVISRSSSAPMLTSFLTTYSPNLAGPIITNQPFFCAFFKPPSDMSFTGSLDFWHRMPAPSRHFDTLDFWPPADTLTLRLGRQRSSSDGSNIIASVAIILSQMPHNATLPTLLHRLLQLL